MPSASRISAPLYLQLLNRGRAPEPVTVWCSGNDVGRINEVALRRARLVLGWVTVCEHTVLTCNQPRR